MYQINRHVSWIAEETIKVGDKNISEDKLNQTSEDFENEGLKFMSYPTIIDVEICVERINYIIG